MKEGAYNEKSKLNQIRTSLSVIRGMKHKQI